MMTQIGKVPGKGAAVRRDMETKEEHQHTEFLPHLLNYCKEFLELAVCVSVVWSEGVQQHATTRIANVKLELVRFDSVHIYTHILCILQFGV